MKKLLLIITCIVLPLGAQASVVTLDADAPCVLSFEKQNLEYIITAIDTNQSYVSLEVCESQLVATGYEIGDAINVVRLHTGLDTTGEMVLADYEQGTIAFEAGDTRGAPVTPSLNLFPNTLVASANLTENNEVAVDSNNTNDETEATTFRALLLRIIEELLSRLRS